MVVCKLWFHWLLSQGIAAVVVQYVYVVELSTGNDATDQIIKEKVPIYNPTCSPPTSNLISTLTVEHP